MLHIGPWFVICWFHTIQRQTRKTRTCSSDIRPIWFGLRTRTQSLAVHFLPTYAVEKKPFKQFWSIQGRLLSVCIGREPAGNYTGKRGANIFSTCFSLTFCQLFLVYIFPALVPSIYNISSLYMWIIILRLSYRHEFARIKRWTGLFTHFCMAFPWSIRPPPCPGLRSLMTASVA